MSLRSLPTEQPSCLYEDPNSPSELKSQESKQMLISPIYSNTEKKEAFVLGIKLECPELRASSYDPCG